MEIETTVPDQPTTTEDPAKQQFIQLIRALMRQATGKLYRVDLDALDVPSLQELIRLLRDVASEKQSAVNRARMNPWSRG